MPPKGSTKGQAKEQPKTPQKTKGDGKSSATPTKTTPKKAAPAKKEEAKANTPKKPKPAVTYTRLARDPKAALPVDVAYQGDIAESKAVKASFTHVLKLDAGAPFTLLDSYLIPEGQDKEGHQVILLKPAPGFKFMKLPIEVRTRIYGFLFFTKGQGSQPIALDGKRKDETKALYAKSFAEGSKTRVGILAVSKEINKEATPILYSRPLRFDNPGTLLNFFADLESHLRLHLRHIELHQYVKKDAKSAFAFLAEAKGLEHLRIEVGIAADDQVEKAVGSFWVDIYKVLEAVGTRIEKTMVPPRKAKLQEAKEESSEDEDEDEDEEEEEEEEAEEDESGGDDQPATEKTVESSQSDHAEATDTKDQVAESTDADDTINVKTEATKPDETTQLDSKTEESTELAKQDSKSPIPSTLPKKKAAQPEPVKLIQGQKRFAVDILDLGKNALKNKNGSNWDNSKKQKFLSLLEGKLNAMYLSLWACVCGTYVKGHSCSAELQARGKSVASGVLREEFQHLGHGGAEKINETYDVML